MSETHTGSLLLGAELSAIAVVYALAVLTILALTIKVITHYIRPKPQQLVSNTAISEELVSEEERLVALAVTAIHKYMSEKGTVMFSRLTRTSGLDPWVSSWRVECSTNADYISVRRVRSGFR